MKLGNRAAALVLSALSVVVLSACPPEWGVFDGGAVAEPEGVDGGVEPDAQPGVDAGPSVLPDGGADGGVDAGPSVLPDGGVNDGGADGGPTDDDGGEDAGDGDGGGDGGPRGNDGGVDAGPDDDGGVVEPICPFPATPAAWVCETGGSTSFPLCQTVSTSPIVDLENVCPSTYILHESGLIQEKKESEATTFANCGGVANRPSRFSDLVAFDDDHMIAYGRGERGICSIILGNCFCEPTTEAIVSAAFPYFDQILLADESGAITESSFEPLLGSSTQITDVDRVRDIVTVSGADRYQLAVYTSQGNVECFERVGTNTPTSHSGCPGEHLNDPNLNDFPFIAASEEVDDERTVFAFSPGTYTAFSALFAAAADSPPMAFRTPLLDPEFEPISFAAIGDVGKPDGRLALGFAGGGVEVALGADDGFSTTVRLPDDEAELGAIRIITPGRDENQFPNNNLWAVSDTGIWLVPLSGAASFTPHGFGEAPATAEVVRIDDDELLVVGTPNGIIQTFLINGSAVTPVDIFFDISSSSATSVIPEAILGVATASEWSHLVVLTTAGEVWAASYNNGASPDGMVRVDGAPNFFTALASNGAAVTDDGRFLLSTPDRSTGDNTNRRVWVTAKENGDRFAFVRYNVTGGALAGNVTLTRLGSTLSVNAPSDTDNAFRFILDDTVSSTELIWTRTNGSMVAVPLAGQPQVGDSSTTNLTDPMSAGSLAAKTSLTCAVAFSANSPRWYAGQLNTPGPFTTATSAMPRGVRINVVRSVNSTTAIAGGDGGHLYEISIDGSTCGPSTVTLVTPHFDRPFADINALQWRGPNNLMVGDAQGRVWSIGIP